MKPPYLGDQRFAFGDLVTLSSEEPVQACVDLLAKFGQRRRESHARKRLVRTLGGLTGLSAGVAPG
jgi:hypothetical protein